MNHTQLRSFHAVAAEGGFTAASRALNVARGIGIGVVSDIEYIPHSDLHTVEVADADNYTTAHTTAHVDCLAERRESRLFRAFFDMAAERKMRRNVTFI